MSIGQFVEEFHFYGISDNRTLEQEQRVDIIEFAMSVEECSQTKAKLESMSDKDLVQAAYRVMAEYASGQF